MNDITIFNHLGNDIRVMTDAQGEPLFVLKDICGALDLKNISDVASRLDEDGVGTTEVIDNLGRTQKTNVIPMQDAVNRGFLTLTERIDPAGKIRPQLLVTPAGQSYFAGILSC